jgi:perosamine synthetase
VLRARLASRLLAPIGGTLTWGDCVAALGHLLLPQLLVCGTAVVAYEQAFADAIGVEYALSFGSGRVALYGLLRAMGVGPGDEVLLQLPTHVVVPNAVRYTGARPVYVDCRPDTYAMDLELAEQRITSRTRVLLVQHTFGIPVDLDAALALADRHGLVVIEDCAHALGASYDGRPVGSFGRAAFFSTEEKTITSAMGGVAVTGDPELARRMRAFQARCQLPRRSLVARYLLKLVVFHVITRPSIHRSTRGLYRFFRSRYIAPGATSPQEARGERPARYEQRLSNGQAAVALRQLRRLDADVARRAAVSADYARGLGERGFDVPAAPAGARPAFARYPVCVDDPARARRAAAVRAVLGQWLSEPIDGAAPPATEDYEPGSCPCAERIARHLVNLPTHAGVRPDDAQAIVEALEGRAWSARARPITARDPRAAAA